MARGAGGPRWFLGVAFGNEHALDESETWFVTSTLIDEQRRREDEARWTSRQEEKLVATVLHELRAPLAPIRYATDVLAGAGVERVDWACRIIRRQVQLVSRLVDDLTDISSILRGGVTLRRETLDLRAVDLKPLSKRRCPALLCSADTTFASRSGDAVVGCGGCE